MHDCLRTQENLCDLLFDEADATTRSRLLAEMESCGACGAQYRTLAATLDACDEAAVALTPRESYWPRYHAALRRRLLNAAPANTATDADAARTPFWERLLTSSVRVPAPLAASVVLLLLAASGLALVLIARPAPEPVALAAPDMPPTAAAAAGDAPQIRFIEVPVIREKTVTQIVYVPRRVEYGGDHSPARRPATRENLAGVRRTDASPANAKLTPPTRANLSGFKPAGEVNLRIIKGSDAREQ